MLPSAFDSPKTSVRSSAVQSDDDNDVVFLGTHSLSNKEFEEHYPEWHINHKVHYEAVLAEEKAWNEETDRMIEEYFQQNK